MESQKWKLAALKKDDDRLLTGTPSEKALYWYMRTRRSGVTRAEMIEALQLSEASVDRALVALRKRGVIEGA